MIAWITQRSNSSSQASTNRGNKADSNTIHFDLQRRNIKMNLTQSLAKDKPVLGFMKFLPNLKDTQKAMVSKAVGKAVFKNRRKRCLSEANVRRIEFMKRVKATTEAFPNKGITDKNFIQKILNYNDDVREANKKLASIKHKRIQSSRQIQKDHK